MPTELYGANQEENEAGPSATIHVVSNRHRLVVDTHLKNFGEVIDKIGVLRNVGSSAQPGHKRYFIRVNREISKEKAAEVIIKALEELIKIGDTWDVWR